MRWLALTLTILTLAACATPQERCEAQATRELNTINDLIDETRANLQRGYALETRTEPRVGLTFCGGNYGHTRFCTGTRLIERKVPVAIDLEEERKKLISLNEKKRQLEAVTAEQIARCAARLGT